LIDVLSEFNKIVSELNADFQLSVQSSKFTIGSWLMSLHGSSIVYRLSDKYNNNNLQINTKRFINKLRALIRLKC